MALHVISLWIKFVRNRPSGALKRRQNGAVFNLEIGGADRQKLWDMLVSWDDVY